MTEQPFTLGVNYWPQTKAMFMWREFERSSIREDLSTIRDLGFTCVGISLLWEDFQPHPKSVPSVMLDRLVDFLEMADDKSLTVIPTLFAGHVAGLNWLPSWMLTASKAGAHFQVFSQNKVRSNKPRNPYSDPEVMEKQILFLRELLVAVSGHPALLAWNLGNEPFRWAVPPDEFSERLWLQAMAETLKEKDDEIQVALGLSVEDLTKNRELTTDQVAEHLDYLGIRVNPQRISWSEGPLDAAVLPFAARITEWLAKRPVMVHDVGLPTIPTVQDSSSRIIRSEAGLTLLSEDDVAEFAHDALFHMRGFRMLGGFWKSYGDYHPSIWDWPPLDKNIPERFSGLLRHDGAPKPATTAFNSDDNELAEAELSSDWLDMSEEDFYKNPESSLVRLYRRFRESHSFK